MTKEKQSSRNYIHAKCGGEIEEIEQPDFLNKILHCLKCDERWEEHIILKDY